MGFVCPAIMFWGEKERRDSPLFSSPIFYLRS